MCDYEIPTDELFQLDDLDINFIRLFLKNEGNLSKTGEDLNLGRVALRTKLREINEKLNNDMDYPGLVTFMDVDDNEMELKPSCEIIRKFNRCHGVNHLQTLKGKDVTIWMTKSGVRLSSHPDMLCKWEIIDALVKKIKHLGGKMYRGDYEANLGFAIGEGLPVNTMEAFIAMEFYGKKIGEGTIRRSTYYAAVMAWGEILFNQKSDGKGGYVELTTMWMNS